ncbi:hypothetical protein N8I74_04840 [Chitiniphilus purpureus]|uniref:Transporter substrate-binding domain-containing protein n=1 Tax=Chitiniphilus purpureus TaxID=2981137 RepID=A0ABY6DPP6_9NEIS|nr:hypothetical protein [Chitiniphilus sp. CD1]UXY16349.1 hypothetical protein N8I74_04840 [Chitiniphilus sp. CD1]
MGGAWRRAAWRHAGGWLLLAWCVVVQAQPPTVPLYVYHDFPPFLVQQGHGDLSQALAQRLTALAQGRYRFEVALLPRKRVDVLLAQPRWRGVVAWVHPAWFGAAIRAQHWSPALMRDQDYWITQRSHPYTVAQIEAGSGLRFGGLLGHRYAQLEAALAAGRLSRIDAANLYSLTNMLLRDRLDVITMPVSTDTWFIDHLPGWREATLRLPRGQPYARHLLSAGTDPALAHFLDRAVLALRRDAAWRRRFDGEPIPAAGGAGR